MSDVEKLKAKIARFPSQAIMFTLEEVLPLITTIESQKEEIAFWKRHLEKYVPADVFEKIVDMQARLQNE